MRFLSVVFLATLVFAGFANATITPVLDAGNPTVDGSNYLWTYQINLSADEELNASIPAGGSYFTIYDFVGYVGGTVAATAPNWTAQALLTGETPSTQLVTDDPGIWNLVFTYTGSITEGPLNIDGFSAESIYGQINANGTFSYQAQKTANTSAPDQGQGPVDIPQAIPEPASMALSGGGLIGLAVLRRKFAR
jgi:hypothetical protein